MAPSILVPLDGSLLAEQALPLAEAVAQALRARMRLALVHQLPPPPLGSSGEKLYVSLELNVRKAQKAYLHRMARTIRGRPRSEIRTAVLEGPVGPAIQKYVQEIGVDLIVMSTHGRGALDRAWLGSVADYLVRTVTVPVLLVHPGAEATSASSFAKPRKIIVPLDGSPLAETVLGPATNLAKALDAEMLLVQVVKPVAIVTDTPGLLAPGFDDQLMSLWRQEAEDYLDDMAEQLRGQGVQATSAAPLGHSVTGTLLDLARPEEGALIAIATHGRGGLRRLMLGSVADKLIRAAHVPVLVVRPTKARRFVVGTLPPR